MERRTEPLMFTNNGCAPDNAGRLEAVGCGLPVAGVRWEASCLASELAEHDYSHRVPAKICKATDSFPKPLSHAPKRNALKNEPPPLREAISEHEWFKKWGF